ncbi:MAG: hypothetical protein LBU65_03990 [Planctomycetaceae bacterium]|jgi:hypothetical protein|nr:hypothetical protein [Planctomycetaceae bacterium]
MLFKIVVIQNRFRNDNTLLTNENIVNQMSKKTVSDAKRHPLTQHLAATNAELADLGT